MSPLAIPAVCIARYANALVKMLQPDATAEGTPPPDPTGGLTQSPRAALHCWVGMAHLKFWLVKVREGETRWKNIGVAPPVTKAG